MESDLHPISALNILFKYADDTNLVVPENTDVSLAEEFDHIKQWALANKMISVCPMLCIAALDKI